MKPKIFHLELFHIDVYYFYGWSRTAYTTFLAKQFKVADDVEGCAGSTMHLHVKNNCDIVTIWTETKDVAALAHECVHAANLTMNDRGVKVSLDNDELQAYLVQLLVEKGLK